VDFKQTRALNKKYLSGSIICLINFKYDLKLMCDFMHEEPLIQLMAIAFCTLTVTKCTPP